MTDHGLVLALSLAGLTFNASAAYGQATDCNNTTYKVVAKEGLQADTVVSTGCDSASYTVHIQLQADGSYLLVSGGVQGAITVTLEGPAECNTDFIEYSGAIYECAGPLQGTHCDPEGARVQVTKWTNSGPCPTLTGLGIPGLTDLINGVDNLEVWALLGLPLSLPCGDMVDDTDSLDPDARRRKTARINKCKSKEAGDMVVPDGATATTSGFFHEQGGALYWSTTQGLREGLEAEFNNAIQDDDRSFRINGASALIDQLHTGDAQHLPESLRAVWENHAPLSNAPKLACDHTVHAQVSRPDGTQDWTKSKRSISGTISASGDADLLASQAIQVADGVEVFMHEWTLLGGDIYHHESSSESGMVYLRRTGATALPMSCGLGFLGKMRGWMTNPFGLLTSPHAQIDVNTTDDVDTLLVTQRIKVSGYDPATDNLLARSIFGKYAEFDVDLSGDAPRIVARRDFDDTGFLQQETNFRAFKEVLPGIWRPTVMVVHQHSLTKGHFRTELFEFSGKFNTEVEPLEVKLPKSVGVEWSFLLGRV